jgi:histidinol-phosphate aminotransferase
MGQLRRVADEAVAGLPNAVDPMALSLNENPFPPLPAVRSALMAAADSANRYPEFFPETLRGLIADHIGVTASQLVLGTGATGVIMQLLHATTDPGGRMAMVAPTFDGYPIFARMARLEPVTVNLDEHGQHDLEAFADIAAQAQVVVLCRPHNPTGTVAPVAVLLDEAYIEFVEPELQLDGLALIQRFPNLLIVRTFSKAYGLAGLRIGYGFGSVELIRKLWGMQLPFGMGNDTLVAVAASYDAEHQLQQRIRAISAERRFLVTRLRAMGVYATDGHANFIYLPPAGAPWPEVFGNTGLKVRHYPGGGVRITIGDRSSTRAVLGAVGASRQ